MISLNQFPIYIYNRLYYPKAPNLLGDRIVEYGFIAANIEKPKQKRAQALDVGYGNGQLSLVLAMAGYSVTAIDLVKQNLFFRSSTIKFQTEDLFNINPAAKFQLIIACSTIEHIGLAGRYQIISNNDNGDINAMKHIRKLLQPQGKLFLTIPVGKDGVFGTKHRVYGKKRLPLLLEGFNIEKEQYWTKAKSNIWYETKKHHALMALSSESFYALGCFMLTK